MTVVERGQMSRLGRWGDEKKKKKRRGNDGRSGRVFSKQKQKQTRSNARSSTLLLSTLSHQQSQRSHPRVRRMEERVKTSLASSSSSFPPPSSSSVFSFKGELEDNKDAAIELGFSGSSGSSTSQSRRGLSAAKTGKGRRELQKRLPQLIEGTRKCLCMKGGKISSQLQLLLKNVHRLMTPNSAFLSRRRQKNFFPFEDCSTAEYLCQKNQASLFCLGSSSKKRPFRLVLGRMFNYALLDEYEFNVSDFEPMESFRKLEYPVVGSKPLLVLQGEAFQRSSVSSALGNFLSDFFRGSEVSELCLETIDRAIVITALPLRREEKEEEKEEDGQAKDKATFERKDGIAASYNSNTNPRHLRREQEEKHESVNQSELCRERHEESKEKRTHQQEEEEEEGKEKKVSASRGFPFTLRFRHYRISLKPSQKKNHHQKDEQAKGKTGEGGNDVVASDARHSSSSSSSFALLLPPHVELEEVGPSFTLSLDRYRLPADDRWAAAMKTPRLTREKKVKNVFGNLLGEKKGRVHVGKQDWRGIHTPHFHGETKQKRKTKNRQ